MSSENICLRRSVTSYRSQGSSGIVWTDDINNNIENSDDQCDIAVQPSGLRHSRTIGTTTGGSRMSHRSHSVVETDHRRFKVAPPSRLQDPPSPKQSCGFFCFPVVSTRSLYAKSKKYQRSSNNY